MATNEREHQRPRDPRFRAERRLLWVQKAKYSLRADIVRFAPDSGPKSDIAGVPVRATTRLMHRSTDKAMSSFRQAGGLQSPGGYLIAEFWA